MEKERSKIRAADMDNLRGFLSIRRMDKDPTTRVKELCGVTERIDDGVLWWFSHGEKMENGRIAKSVRERMCGKSLSGLVKKEVG